jgi:phospholipid/cholesterol/gamma-HCH transport system ATP-binding protein
MPKPGCNFTVFSSGKSVSSDHFIEFRNVSFAYGERSILNNISLVIPRGKLVAIMGAAAAARQPCCA